MSKLMKGKIARVVQSIDGLQGGAMRESDDGYITALFTHDDLGDVEITWSNQMATSELIDTLHLNFDSALAAYYGEVDND